MLTSTGTLSVNAAFLQEIKEDNQQLRVLLDRTAAILTPGGAVWVRPETVADMLGQLRDLLAMHFSLEEYFGYFDNALDAAPWLSTQADILRAQHESLFREICDLVDDAEKMLYRERPRVTQKQICLIFECFHNKLKNHEEAENELICRALFVDVGVKSVTRR